MTIHSRWMIRLSLVYFLIGALAGAAMLIHKAYTIHPSVWLLLPIHIEVVIFGWIIQFTMGTAYWILPRYLKGSKRGSTVLAWMMIGLLNTGILLILATNLLEFSFNVSLIGRGLELIAVLFFIVLQWRRVVSYRGEK